jgi:hypothetical protein
MNTITIPLLATLLTLGISGPFDILQLACPVGARETAPIQTSEW